MWRPVLTRKIVLVTKTVTQNQGNQALSIAWRNFLGERFPGHVVRPVERAPAYLKRYRTAMLAREDDPLAAFERIAAALVAEMRLRPKQPAPAIPVIRHDPKIAPAIPFRRLRRLLRLRSRLSALGVAKRHYFDRLALFEGAELIVINPAGEFQRDADDTAIAYLFDLRCAQLLGARTAMVNLSFEVEHPVVRRISAATMDRCDILEFRDIESGREYAASGGKRTPLILADGALMTTPPAPAQGTAAGIGVALAINALQVNEAGLEGEWTQFIDRMIAHGMKPVLTSNEWSTDERFWGPLIAGRKIAATGRELDYIGYMKSLADYEAVISSRLHTCVLAIVAGVPVVPVETGKFKLTGFFEQIGFKTMPIKLGGPGWDDAVLARTTAIRSNRAAILAEQNLCRDNARTALIDGLTAAFKKLPIA